MKEGIHPEYKEVIFKCACGNEIVTKSTAKRDTIAICSACHPFFTGKQKFVDAAGRVEKFMKKYDKANTNKKFK
ncbi:50S ribosomal protein L31 [Deferribacterales bacterium Es71-Z0220]|uniref:50S ribosomal protein L31 n=1 Tax=Deferrivibrio essentukiensis TaxID=2880922 RepID=UPI001F60A38E|nr:50S ribosomal protein L31 [Deferrivibrio essentukiensis]MCB4203738.1 50S ribosomal protein L31 [Deferrivibrio essentukiensis]